jgi:hypothetical protein
MLIAEVVVQLTLAGARGRSDIVEAGCGRSTLGDQRGGGPDDPLAGFTAVPCCSARVHVLILVAMDWMVHSSQAEASWKM